MKIEVSLSEIMSIASALVHYEEAHSPGGVPDVDIRAAESWKSNPEAVAIMAKLDNDGFLPLRRDGVTYK